MTNRYVSRKKINLEDRVDRQRKLKQLLLKVKGGAMISPIIFEIEEMYELNKVD